MANKSVAQDYYEMRRGGEVLCTSSVPNLGYPVEWLRAWPGTGSTCTGTESG